MKIQSITTDDNITYNIDLGFVYNELDCYDCNNRYIDTSLYDHRFRPCNLRALKDGSFLVIDYSWGVKRVFRLYPKGIKRIDYH